MMQNAIEKNIIINAAPSVVFDALTNSEKILQYFPLNEVISDWKVGSEVLFKGTVNGADFTDYGKIEQLTPNKIFQYTYWSDNHGTERTPENHLTICYSLSATEQGTQLKMEHKNLISAEMHAQMLGVWDFLLSSLKDYAEQTTHR